MRQLVISKKLTNREESSLNSYLQEIGNIELISAEEEAELARRIHAGDIDARDSLVKANLRFVVSVSKQYQNKGLGLQDLINEGNFGLIKAAERFDETRGFKFISYAVWWIRQSILKALSEQGRIVRLPVNRTAQISKLLKTVSALEQKYEREPTVQEISDAMEFAPLDVKEAVKNSMRHVSFDAPFSQDEDRNLYSVSSNSDSVLPDEMLIRDSLRSEIDRVINTLSAREANILRLSFGLNGIEANTLEEIGEIYNLTRERVRQIKEKATRSLKHFSKSRLLISYLN
ncbi:MAG: RNA polymerase sigma factor RpoD/SigA [Bacteroidales bacterium]|nr:RNA polymerase sigma factor RpoD/SigA [Bacteroidales bacterium]